MKALIADDDGRIVSFLAGALRSEGWMVKGARDGDSAIRLASEECWDVVLLDLLMPGPDGLQVLKEILDRVPDQPVIVVSGRNDIATKVAALNAGAADYLSKPFSIDELLARVNSRRRRETHDSGRLIRRGNLLVDLNRRTVNVGGQPVTLTDREFVLLVHMMGTDAMEAKVYSREELLSAEWGYNFDPGSNVVDVYVRRLRTKLGPGVIETVRKVGYYLAAAFILNEVVQVATPSLTS